MPNDNNFVKKGEKLETPTNVSFQIMPNEGEPRDSLSMPPTGNLPHDIDTGHSWSKTAYIIIGFLVLAVVGAAAYFLLGFNGGTQQEAVTQLPESWLKTNFNVTSCVDQSACGDSSDPDNDGLTNYEEFKVRKGTDPHNADSDGDGLSDGDEAHIFKTEPAIQFSVCTGNSGIACQYDDGSQISNDYDPYTPGIKMTETRQKQIAEDTEKYKLHEPTSTTLQAKRTGASAASQAKTYTVTIENSKFMPSTLNIKVGDSVIWVNKDVSTHQIVGMNLDSLASPVLVANATYSIQLTAAGSITYFDKSNPSNKGTITVK